MEKRYAFASISGVLLSTLTIVIMATLRTDGYDHLHKAVSELGSLDASNRYAFNILGYILPGLSIGYLALGLRRHWSARHPIFVYSLLLSGLFLVIAGVFPMDMNDRRSFNSLVHTTGSIGSGLAWLGCGFSSWRTLRNEPAWRNLSFGLTLLPVLVILAILMTPDDKPALGQRFAFIGYFLFVVLLSIRLLRTAKHPAKVRDVA